MLKGRENYSCWRSTRLQTPSPDSSGEDWLAWTRFLLFSAIDTADLTSLKALVSVKSGHGVKSATRTRGASLLRRACWLGRRHDR